MNSHSCSSRFRRKAGWGALFTRLPIKALQRPRRRVPYPRAQSALLWICGRSFSSLWWKGLAWSAYEWVRVQGGYMVLTEFMLKTRNEDSCTLRKIQMWIHEACKGWLIRTLLRSCNLIPLLPKILLNIQCCEPQQQKGLEQGYWLEQPQTGLIYHWYCRVCNSQWTCINTCNNIGNNFIPYCNLFLVGVLSVFPILLKILDVLVSK